MKDHILCVWCGVTHNGEPEKMIEYLNGELKTKFIYEREFFTLPDTNHNNHVPNTGGRKEQLFWLPIEDVSHVAIPRLQYEIRWWEDYRCNEADIIPNEIKYRYRKEFHHE